MTMKCQFQWWRKLVEVEVEWGFYALSASKAIFRARTQKKLIESGDDDYLMNETRRKPTTGRQSPTLLDKSFGDR